MQFIEILEVGDNDMRKHFTADETKQDHIKKLEGELGILYHEIRNEVSQLHLKWNEYVELFGTNHSRVELLNESAPFFFKTIQDALFESILLHITRLTDPPKSFGKDNLSVKRFAELVDDEIKQSIDEQIDITIEKSNFCRDWRNRHIAHKDLRLVIDSQAKLLQTASRAKVKDALKSIAKVLNIVSEHYMDSTTIFDLISNPQGAETLLYLLDDGLRAIKERENRIKAGYFQTEDLIHRSL